MSLPVEPVAEDELQFKTAEPVIARVVTAGPQAGSQGCARCKRPISSTYFAVGKHAICPDCRVLLDPPLPGTRFTRFLKASVFGLGAGLAGALIWYAVRRLTQMEIGLIAVLVGFMVGKAVRKGSGTRGGRGYQVLAVVLTYCCIAANYMPDIAQELLRDVQEKSAATSGDATNSTGTTSKVVNSGAANQKASASGTSDKTSASHTKPNLFKVVGAVLLLIIIVFGLSLAAPFLMGAQNIIGLLIIGFALWEAWKFNRKIALPITGPYQVGVRSPNGIAGGVA